MPKRGPYNVAHKYSMQPRDIWERLIFTYATNNNEESRVRDFETYLRAHGVIIDRQYFAICDVKKQHDNLRKKGSRLGISLRRSIPLQEREDCAMLERKFLPLSDSTAFQRNDDGWLYLFFDEGNTCLYVGLTRDHYPLRRPGHHFEIGTGRTPWHKYLQENAGHADGWAIIFVRPSDCDALIRKSFFLPCDVEKGIPNDFDKQYQEKRALERDWWRRRAERVLIAVYRPRFNSDGMPLDEATRL